MPIGKRLRSRFDVGAAAEPSPRQPPEVALVRKVDIQRRGKPGLICCHMHGFSPSPLAPNRCRGGQNRAVRFYRLPPIQPARWSASIWSRSEIGVTLGQSTQPNELGFSPIDELGPHLHPSKMNACVVFAMFSVGVPKMNDVDVRFYLSILLQRLPYIVGIAGLAVGISVVFASYLPPVYRASARILAEAPQIPVDLVRSTVSMNGMEQLQIVQQQITTRDDLLALADKLDIYADSEDKPSNEKLVDDMRARITFDQLQLNADSSGAAVFSVGFQARDPVLAAKVANELAALILHRNQRQRADVAGSTLQFFDEEVARLGEELNRTEADILKFKNENKDTLPDSLEFRRQQQNSQQERLVSLDREESDLRSRRRNLVETYGTSGQLMAAGPISPEQQMLTDLNRALAEQLGMFAETSPSVVALRARIASLQARLHPTGDSKTDRTVGGRPVTLLDMQLADIDERLQLIARERTTIVKNVADLTKSIEATPAAETVMNALERTRTNLQTQYNTAIAKRAEASIGKQVEANSDGERFSLLELATPPEKKISPKRWRIVGMGAAAGIGLGLGFALLLEMLNKTIRRSSEVTQALQTQLLATIPYIDEPRKRRIGNRYYPMPLMGALRKFRSG